MGLIDIRDKTVRQTKSPFLQLQIQWFIEDITNEYVDLNYGCTSIVTRSTPQHSTECVFDIYGKDITGKTYKKTVNIDMHASDVPYYVQSQSYIVQSDKQFFVKAVDTDYASYGLINIAGVYIVLDMDILDEFAINTTFNVYEFNTIFPPSSRVTTEISDGQVVLSIDDLALKDTDDFIWTSDNDRVMCSQNNPTIIGNENTFEAIEVINGISMTTGVVNVDKNLAEETTNNHSLPNLNNALTSFITIPKTPIAPASYLKLPQHIAGILPNEQVYNNYGFTLQSFNNNWNPDEINTDNGVCLDWYNAALALNTSWVTIPENNNIPDDMGVADLSLKIDGNIQTMPALTANVVGYTPEYRLFNAKFSSKHKVEDNDNTGYFTLYNIKGTTDEFAVVDAGTVNKNGTDSGPSIAIVKTSTTQRTFEQAYATLDFVDSGDCIVTLEARLGEKEDLSDMLLAYVTYSSIENVPADTDTVKTKVIGRVKKVAGKLKMYQDHVGIIYFDFIKASEAPENSASKGFFKLNIRNEGNKVVAVMSDCIFRLNGRYCRLDDYIIDSWFEPWNFVYLKLSHNAVPCSIERFVYFTREEAEIFDSPEYILLYIIHQTEDHFDIERYAAGMIDTVYLGEGFLYVVEEEGLKSTVTRNWKGNLHSFDNSTGDIVYIPCFSSEKREGVNIHILRNKGGVIQAGKGDNYYYWNTTGLPTQWSTEVITVKVNPEKVYF